MTFTQTFGGTTIYPAGVSYRAVALSADQTLSWPVETATNGDVVAQIMDVTPSAGSLSIIMPPANEVSVGETTLFFNPGAFTFTVKDNGGNTIVAIAAGLSYQVYLIGNSTVNGTWRSTQYAAGTSVATAGSLVGAGIKAISTTLNQSMSVTTLNSNYAIGDADRSEAFVWNGGAGAFTLPSSGTVGNDWFCQLRNSGTGAITLTPTGAELINGAANLTFNPGDSAIVICDGSAFFTIGFGQSAAFAFDYVSIDLSSPVTSPYTLSGANLNRIAYSFGGTLTTNMEVLIPATIQQYWISNDTSGAFTLTVKVAGQTGVVIPQGSRGIYYCNGTDIIDADTASFAFPLTVAQGGTGATTESGARINLGGTSVGIGVFTAVTAADGRNALIAAKSGANSDITSLTGLTTPLSVGQGGTGVATLTANGVVLGNGASALAVTAVGTTGQVLVGNTGAAPTWSTLSGIGVTSFSAGTTGLTPSTATTGVVTLAGTLGVANGGTGTATAFTSGSVVFSGASGVYTQDNANLFWDDTNNRLGIGTASPSVPLDVAGQARASTIYATSSTASSFVTRLTNQDFQIYATNGVATGNSGDVKATIGLYYADNLANLNGGIQFTRGGAGTDGWLNFLTSGTERMRIDTSGNVGIGTSSPQSRLNVEGGSLASGAATGILAAGSIATGRLISGGGSTVNAIHTYYDDRAYEISAGSTSGYVTGVVIAARSYTGTAGDAVTLWTRNAERMRIDGSGNVMIGGTTANSKLDVNGDLTLRNGSGITIGFAFNNSGWMDFAGSANVNGTQMSHSGTLRFLTASTERMRIDSSGNVGIGTSSPVSVLNVSGTTGFTWPDGGGTSSGLVTIGTQGTGGSLFVNTASLSAGFASGLAIDGTYSSLSSVVNIKAVGVKSGGGYNASLAFHTSFETTLAERMRIDSSGNVGIGTSGPSSYGKLAVIGNIASSTDGATILTMRANAGATTLGAYNTTASSLSFTTNTGGGGEVERMRITDTGNVGIGTSSPGAKLEVTGSVRIYQSTGGVFNMQYTTANANSRSWQINHDVQAYGDFSIQQSTTQTGSTYADRLLIDASGNVGIGAASPSAKLDVRSANIADGTNGGIINVYSTTAQAANVGGKLDLGGLYDGSNSLSFASVAGRKENGTSGDWSGYMQFSTRRFGADFVERMRIDSSGNVGIGTSSPAEKLDVAGNAKISSGSSFYWGDATSQITAVNAGAMRFLVGNGGEKMRIDGSGDVGIGTTSPSQKLDIGGGGNLRLSGASTGDQSIRVGTSRSGNGYSFIDLQGDTTYDNGLRIIRTNGGANTPSHIEHRGTGALSLITQEAGPITFLTSATERARIDTSGNLLVGTTAAGQSDSNSLTLQPSGGIGVVNHATGTASGTGYFAFALAGTGIGSITQSGTTAVLYNTSSDYRLKDIDGPVANSGAYIDALKPVQGSWKADGSRFIGLLAHEVQEVSETPIATGEKDGEKMQAMDYSAPELIANLIAEIQSLRARVAQLEGN
jgi:hypothetical protein